MPMPYKQQLPNIKIFVSRRIDVNSITVPNPIYIPVRCGAIFDPDKNSIFQGDNTGENISHKRINFCEFTVQYWVWKNISADYYGLCHYRRYLSFAAKKFKTNDHGVVPCAILSPETMKCFGLLDTEVMKAEITRYDLIIPQPALVERMPLPHGKAKSVYHLWEAHSGIFFEKGTIDRVFSLIEELAPEYSTSAKEYFAGNLHRGYNCYVMQKGLFNRLCQFQFPIMEVIEAEIDTTMYPRAPGYVGEILFGIFLHHAINHERWRVNQRQLVLFAETQALDNPFVLACWYLYHGMDCIIRAVAKPFFPLGSKRREMCKAIYGRLIKNCKSERQVQNLGQNT